MISKNIFMNSYSGSIPLCLPVKNHKGFTLIELLVSVAIIGMITAVIMFNQSSFSDRLALSNTVSDIELEIRQSQVYGVSVREFASTPGEFTLAYGASFIIGGTGSSNSSFISFADKKNPTANGYYDTPTATCTPDAMTECLRRTNFTHGNIITKLCVIQSNGASECSPSVGRIDITFLRPNPDARIAFFNSAGTQISYPNHLGARIELRSPKGVFSSVVVSTAGQISVE
jgi:prepilin-type N-terminal cleavage/methylation domain-containing protein